MPPDFRREIEIEAVVRLNRNQLVGAVATAANVAIMTIALWRDELRMFLVLWCIIGQALALLQFAGWIRVRRRGNSRPSRIRRRTLLKAVALSLVGGLFWGSLAVAAMPQATPGEAVVIMFTVGGMATGAAVAVAILPVVAAAFFLSAFWMAVISCMIKYPDSALLFAVLCVNYMLFLGLIIWRANRQFTDLMQRQLENLNLAVEAHSASEARSRFIAHVSHELRTPLNAIIGFADMMHGRILGPVGNDRYEEYVGAIGDSGRHLLSIINDILDISRIDAGSNELRETSIPVRLLVERCRKLFADRCTQAGVDFSISVADEDAIIRADERLVTQILFNLLSNALAHTARGGTVTLAVERLRDHGICIAIGDSGAGMSREQLAIARQPFAPLGNTWVARGGGAGLGLPISHRFAALHAGHLLIDSAPGTGTRCRLLLPAERVTWIAEPMAARKRAAASS
ncbi:MAG: HAMP domain-containing sensor histidine kinase [Pseudomonadota bacterium]|nr:HAMP domain-containing sensor histidine kinase [Pseudomonadota bacterium]